MIIVIALFAAAVTIALTAKLHDQNFAFAIGVAIFVALGGLSRSNRCE